MGNKIRSARGDQVDFDLLRIKEQIAASPPPQDVKLRQDFIEKRLRRRLKKVPTPAPKIETNDTKEPIVTPVLAGTETLSEEPKIIDEVETTETKTTTKSRQRTKKPVLPNTEV